MTTHTEDRQAKLDALLDALRDNPTPELIVRSMDATGPDPTVPADLERVDVASAGAWAFDRMTAYLERLRSLNEERKQLGLEIDRLKRHPYPKRKEEIGEAAWARVMAPILAGKQEVVYNFFCVSVQHIRSLLIITADAVGYQIPQPDLDFLDQFRHLRNFYEHWDERLPGKNRDIALITRTMTPDEYHIRGGLRTDEKDRIIVVEPKKPFPVAHIVDVTAAGVERVERITRETWEGVKKQAIENVRAFYIANPDKDIPQPESIDQELLISVGGYYEPGPTRNPAWWRG